MSIEQTNIVDAIGTDHDANEVVLTIADHLPWSGEDKEHLYLLQEKINTYLAFIEGGEIYHSYPSAKAKQFVIEVVFQFSPNDSWQWFLSRIEPIVSNAGIALRHRVFDAGE